MTPEKMGEKLNEIEVRLGKIDVKISHLCALLDIAASDIGFSRCAVRLERLTKLEKTNSYIVRAGIGATIVIVLVELWRFVLTMVHVLPSL